VTGFNNVAKGDNVVISYTEALSIAGCRAGPRRRQAEKIIDGLTAGRMPGTQQKGRHVVALFVVGCGELSRNTQVACAGMALQARSLERIALPGSPLCMPRLNHCIRCADEPWVKDSGTT